MPTFAILPVYQSSRERAVARPKPPRARRGTRRLDAQTLTLLIDRVEAAVEAGAIALVELPRDVPLAGGPAIDLAAYAAVLAILFAEEFSARMGRVVATRTAPGTAERIEVYRQRVKKGLPATFQADAAPDDRRALKIEARGNGTGARVVGWSDEGDDDDL